MYTMIPRCNYNVNTEFAICDTKSLRCIDNVRRNCYTGISKQTAMEGGEAMSMDAKTTLVQVRMSEEQKEDLRELAVEYRLDVSELIRKLIEFAKVEHPNLLRPLDAPMPEIAGVQITM
jgi:hypothetical protein